MRALRLTRNRKLDGKGSLPMKPKPAKLPVSPSARVRSRPQITKAYRHVQAAGLASTSLDIREKTKAFNANAISNLERIQKQLRESKFRFAPPRPVLVSKGPGKGKRGILIAPIESRIVQRAILDELIELPTNREKLNSGFNFGGVAGPEFGVKPAVLKASNLSLSHKYFLRSDVQKFFDQVPRSQAVAHALAGSIDGDFNQLVRDSVEVDEKAFSNVSEEDRRIFLSESLGLAQGSSISAMLCNLYLDSFDRALNSRGVECVRYVDDFIIFGGSKASVRKAFAASVKHLEDLGLKAYDPKDNPDKAEEGPTTSKIRFLGCEIHGGIIRPTDENRRLMLKNLDDSLARELSSLRKNSSNRSSVKSIANAAKACKAIVEGWGNSFAFCNDTRLFHSIDIELEKRVENFLVNARKILSSQHIRLRQKAMGFHFLEDCSGLEGKLTKSNVSRQ